MFTSRQTCRLPIEGGFASTIPIIVFFLTNISRLDLHNHDSLLQRFVCTANTPAATTLSAFVGPCPEGGNNLKLRYYADDDDDMHNKLFVCFSWRASVPPGRGDSAGAVQSRDLVVYNLYQGMFPETTDIWTRFKFHCLIWQLTWMLTCPATITNYHV